MIYTTGTIAINGNTVKGTGTNFSEPLSLIRVGCTLIAVGNSVQIFTITEIKNGTELSVTPAANPVIPAGTKFSILLSDSISVDGLAQDVAETLRYYQGKETEIATAVEWWNEFGGDGQMDQLLADIRAETAQSTANAQKTETDKNAAEASKTAAAKSATAAKTSETNAKNSEVAAKTSETKAKTSEDRAQEYLNQMGRLTSPMVQCNWPVTTIDTGAYVKIAKVTNPGIRSCHLTLMVTNGGKYGLSHGNIDFIEISARDFPYELNAGNVSNYLSIRRLGTPNLATDKQMRYGLVKGDEFFEVWVLQTSYIIQTKVAVLSQTNEYTELYIPEGFVKQDNAPSGFIESQAVRIYDQENKPSKSDVGLGNVTNDAQVKKSGDIMSGDLSITKATPSLYLCSKNGTAHVWFKNEDQSERGVIFAPVNTDTLGEVHIMAKNAKGESSGDLIVRHDGKVEVRDLSVEYKIKSATAEVSGNITCQTLHQSSDRDLKDNIQVIGDATEAIRKMNGYTYTLKENGLPYAGVIAQEVMEAIPEAVGSFTHYGKELQGPTIDGNELREETRYLNVDYAAVTGLLVQVARETDNRVTELEEENASLRANIAAMDERIAKLEALVSKLTGSEK
ncbi:tail fiber domain-containing protein [Escherichia coli]|uniref:tail fiber domain-containing protein n=1 Tax=Escherichia coli TaxID=562 RepID=UPI003F8F005E